jgi:hypothetical protein
MVKFVSRSSDFSSLIVNETLEGGTLAVRSLSWFLPVEETTQADVFGEIKSEMILVSELD